MYNIKYFIQYFWIIQAKLDLVHRRTDANCIHWKDNSPKPGEQLTPAWKSQWIKSSVSMICNRIASDSKPLGQVKSDRCQRLKVSVLIPKNCAKFVIFLVFFIIPLSLYDPYCGKKMRMYCCTSILLITLCVNAHFDLICTHKQILEGGPKVKSDKCDHIRRFLAHDFQWLVSCPKPLGAIMSE